MDEISDELKQAATRHWNDYFSRLKPETWDECKHTIRVRSFIAGAKWRENQKPSTSDEALPIGDVVNCSSCKYQMNGTTEPCRSCILFSNHTPK
jgi:hypothetical protein